MKILIIGGGYVGLNTAYRFRNNHVTILDSNRVKVEIIPGSLRGFMKYETIKDIDELNFTPDIVFICLPTPYIDGSLNTTIIEQYIKIIRELNVDIKIVVRSTVPIGFSQQHHVDFMPEFLTEKTPFEKTRTVYGGKILPDCVKSIELMCSPTEAEMIKLMSNAYLSTRLAFFHEVSQHCVSENLDFDKVHFGVCSDPRIGFQYANPPFLINENCLAKDLDQAAQYSILFSAVKTIKDNQ